MAFTVGSLFSGIGGIDLGLERAGMVTRWFCEIDPHCRNVLARHWPGLPIYGDITAVDWSGVEPVDVLAGGFPCQPVSQAGRKLAQNDERWLWPEFERAIRHLRPRYILVENVPGLRVRGMGDVLGGLAALGYDAEWDSIPATAVGAPHTRDRLWIVAYPEQAGLSRPVAFDGSPGSAAATLAEHGHSFDRARDALDGRSDHLRAGDGVSVAVERRRIGAIGNAVVPQVVEWIGTRIVAFDEGREVAA